MRSLLLSNFISNHRRIATAITWIARELTGILFIFSGFTKAVDPAGTLFKINEYLSVWGLNIWPSLVLVGTFTLCAIEFIVGVMLCFGSFRRTITWVAMAIMCFMLPLTLWIAIANPVADCGCFGDAFIISNWATFWKNIALTCAIAWLIKFNRSCRWIVTPALQWIALVATSIFIFTISLWGYHYQPLIDFRQYKVGSTIIDDSNEEESADYIFIYEKDGIKKEFSANDELPDENEGWTFVDRKEIGNNHITTVDTRKEKNFRLWDKEGMEDVTEDVISSEGDMLILMMPELKAVSIASTWKINSLYDWATNHNIEMIAAVTGSPKDISTWEDLAMPEYQIYTADDTSIKEVVRGNPALVFIRDGVIMWKSTLKAVNVNDFMSLNKNSNPMRMARNNRKILIKNLSTFSMAMALLVFLSFTPKITNRIFRRKKKPTTHDDTAPREE